MARKDNSIPGELTVRQEEDGFVVLTKVEDLLLSLDEERQTREMEDGWPEAGADKEMPGHFNWVAVETDTPDGEESLPTREWELIPENGAGIKETTLAIELKNDPFE